MMHHSGGPLACNTQCLDGDVGVKIAQLAVRYGFVPFMLLGLNGAAYFVVANGHSYAWLVLLLIVGFASAFAAERILPYFDEWNVDQGDVRSNVWHALVYEGSSAAGMIMIPVTVYLFPLEPDSLLKQWPVEWPMLAQLLFAIIFADLAFTIIHFLSHRWAPLWRLHAVHHGVSRLYGFNGLVRHPLHQMLDMAIGTAPLAAFGMPLEIAVLLGFAISIQLIIQHSNVDHNLGPFQNHLSIGRLHHLHHVSWGTEGDCNFGLFFTIWDRIFGTFKPEPSRQVQAHDLGIDDVPNFPKPYLAQLAFPFRYQPARSQRRENAATVARREFDHTNT